MARKKFNKAYKLYTYDVWGNEEDGYEVNNVYATDRVIYLPSDPSDKDILDALRRAGEIRKGVRSNLVQIEGESGYTLYISYKHRPEMELRRSSEDDK